MSILCKLFGHRKRSGWFGDGLYGEVLCVGRDGYGCTHFRVTLACDRCRQTYTAARFHGSQVGIDGGGNG